MDGRQLGIRLAVLVLACAVGAGCGGGDGGSAGLPDVRVDGGGSAFDVGYAGGDGGSHPFDVAPDVIAVATSDARADVPRDVADVRGDAGDDIGGDAVPDVPTEPCAPIGPSGLVGPGGYPLDGWTWERHGVVLADAAAGAQDGYFAPSLLTVDGTLVLYLTRKEGLRHRLWRATSTDGVDWSAPAEVVGLGVDDVVAYPSARWDGGRYHLWFGGGVIEYATSVDGVAWTLGDENALGPGGAGAFDALTVLYPNVLADGGVHTMWYVGFDGQSFAIGRARSADGRVFVREPAEPVLTQGAEDAFDNRSVAQPMVLPADGGFWMWYGAYDTSRTDPGPYRVGLAWSEDGVAWEKQGVTLELSASGPDAYSTRDPAVVPWDGGLLMVYAGLGTDLRYRLLSATSRNCWRAGPPR